MASFSYADMARRFSPETAAKEAEAARLNSDLEGQAPAPASTATTPWRLNANGTQSRIIPSRGVREVVQNIDGTVMAGFEEYTPPPVDDKKSYAEILLTDITNRTDMINRKLLAGDIPAAEAERAQVDKFISDNSATLHKFTRYTGRDPMTLAASQKAMDLVTGAWLPPEQRAFFDPRVNPAAVARDAAVMGLSPAAAQAVANARDGKGPDAVWDSETLNAAGPEVGSLVTKSATKQQAAQLAARVAAEPSGGGINDWFGYRDDARQKLGASLPADVLSDPNMSPSALVSTFRTAFDSNDRASGLSAIDAGVKAVAGATDMSPTDKANLFHSTVKVFTDTVKSVGVGNDPAASALVAKTITAVQTVIPADQLYARKDVVQNAVKQAFDFGGTAVPAEASGALASALAKRSLGQSKFDDKEKFALNTFSDVSRMVAGVTISDDPTMPALSELAAAVGPTGTALAEAEHAKLREGLNFGYSQLQNSMKSDAKRAGVTALATGKPLSEVLDESASSMADTYFSTGKKSREESDVAAKLSLRILSQQGSFDVRNINAEISKYPEIVREVQSQAEEAAAAAASGSATAKVEVAKDLSQLVDRMGGEGTADGQTVMAIDEITTAQKDTLFGTHTMRGNSEYIDMVDKLTKKGVGPWADALTSSNNYKPSKDKAEPTSEALRVLFASDYSTLKSPETLAAAKAAFLKQAKESGPLISANIGIDGVTALADSFVNHQVELIRRRVGYTEGIKGNTKALLGSGVVSTWDSTAPVFVNSAADMKEAGLPVPRWLNINPVSFGPNPAASTGAPAGAGPERRNSGNVDFSLTAVYLFANKVLGAGEEPGLSPYNSAFLEMTAIPFAGKLGAYGIKAKSRSMYEALKPAEAAATEGIAGFKKTLASALADAESLDSAVDFADDIAKAASVEAAGVNGLVAAKAANKMAPWLKYGGRALGLLSDAGLGASAIYDMLQQSQVPSNDKDVAVRAKGYMLSRFEIPNVTPIRKAVTPVAGGLMPISNQVASASTGTLVRGEEQPLLRGAIAAMRNAADAADKPVMNAMAREFLSEKGISTAFKGKTGVGLQGTYLNDTLNYAKANYSPRTSWSEYMKNVSSFAAKQVTAQDKYLTDLMTERAKNKAEVNAEVKNAGALL